MKTDPNDDVKRGPSTALERQRRRRHIQVAIEALTKSSRGNTPLSPAQNRELDLLVRELNELDATDLMEPQ